MADSLLQTLLARIRPTPEKPAYPELPPAPKWEPKGVDLPMNWTLGEAYGRLREFDPTLVKGIRSVEFSKLPNRVEGRVSPVTPNKISLSELYLPQYGKESDGLGSIGYDEFDPAGALRLLGHEARHVRDFSQKVPDVGDVYENNAKETENSALDWLFRKLSSKK